MSLRIKLPKQALQNAGAARSSKPSKRRIHSDDEDADPADVYADDADASQPRTKRGRTEEGSTGGGDEVADGEVEVEMDVDIEADLDDTRFLPPATASASASPPPVVRPGKRKKVKTNSESKSRGSGSGRSSGRKLKRGTVVWTDSDNDEDFVDAGRVMDPEDEDFDPEPVSTTQKKGASGSKAKNGKLVTGAKGGRGRHKKEEKEIVIRDERKLHPPSSSASKDKTPIPSTSSKRSLPKDDGPDADASTLGIPAQDASDKAQGESPTKPDDLVVPPPKKRKLPTIKKNKTSTAPSTPAAAKLPATGEKKDAPGATGDAAASSASGRKTATVTNTDFDLRDKSVYAQLFSKPGGSTPNSGLNRKEKEEERRKELNRMRDEARAKRAEEAKHSFDLQAAHEKISRFEEKLRARKSMAAFPNVLGGFFKAAYDETFTKEAERKE